MDYQEEKRIKGQEMEDDLIKKTLDNGFTAHYIPNQYQELENRALEEYRKGVGETVKAVFSIAEDEAGEFYYKYEDVENFLKSHLQSAYEAGKQSNKNEITPKEMKKAKETLDKAEYWFTADEILEMQDTFYEAGKREENSKLQKYYSEKLKEQKEFLKDEILKWAEENMEDEGGRQSKEERGVFYPNDSFNIGYNQYRDNLIQYLQNK